MKNDWKRVFAFEIRGFAQHSGVNEVGHSVSVDSDSTGTKKPFSGHASNQSTSP